jgi:hypothetical protein
MNNENYKRVMALPEARQIGSPQLTAISRAIQQDGIFFSFKSSQFRLQLFMQITVSAHHTGAHGKSETILSSRVCIGFPYFWVVGQPQIIIKAPNDLFLAPELHPVSNLSFQLWEGKITMRAFSVLSKRTLIA